MIWFGDLLHTSNILKKLISKTTVWISAVVSTVILIVMMQFGPISLNSNLYDNPLILVICTVSGFIMIYSISQVFLALGEDNIAIIALTYISQHAMPIIGLHFLCFKLVNVVVAMLYGYESYMIAAFPTLATTGLWWVAYMLVGIGIPLGINYVWMECKKRVIASWKKNGRESIDHSPSSR